MTDYGTVQQHQQKKTSIVIDCSEYIFGLSLIAGLIGMILGFIMGITLDIIISIILLLICILSIWRVRKLGIAKNLMDSVNDLQSQNDKLQQTNDEMKTEVDNFRKLVGLVGENVQDIEAIERQLFQQLDKLEKENKKYQQLNRLHAFLNSDLDRDGVISEEEMKILNKFIDNIEDKNGDLKITIEDI